MTDLRPRSHALPSAKATRPSPYGDADACFKAMQRHHERSRAGGPLSPGTDDNSRQPPPNLPPAAATGGTGDGGRDNGDIIYGARAIAVFLFNDASDRARRRVFNIWAHYQARKEKAGLFKLNGALCLSKSQWRKFHGLGDP